MIEILVLLAIVLAFAHRPGEPWGRTTDRLGGWAAAAGNKLEAWLARARDQAPGVLGQCLGDLDDLRDDLLGALGPSLRGTVESRWPKLAEGRRPDPAGRGAQPVRPETAEPSPLPPTTGLAEGAAARLRASGAEALGRLQQRYVEGAISLDQYTSEVARLRTRPS